MKSTILHANANFTLGKQLLENKRKELMKIVYKIWNEKLCSCDYSTENVFEMFSVSVSHLLLREMDFL